MSRRLSFICGNYPLEFSVDNMGRTMQRQYNRLDLPKALRLRAQGYSNTIIAQRLGVTHGTVYLALRKHDAQHDTRGIPKRIPRTVSRG